MSSRRIAAPWIVALALAGAASHARADDSRWVVSAGGDVGLGGDDDVAEQFFPALLAAGYLRVSRERRLHPPPRAPVRKRRAALWLTPELTLGHGADVGNSGLTTLTLGARTELLLVTRRPDGRWLRGGFWLAARAGVARTRDLDAVYEGTVGSFITFGQSDWRFSYEFGLRGIRNGGRHDFFSALLRLGFGRYL